MRDDDVEREVAKHAALLGAAIHAERLRRRLTLAAVADLAGVGLTTVHDVESGRCGSLETYVRLGRALRLRREFGLLDGRDTAQRRAEDPVHAAMGEVEAEHFRGLGFHVGVDEPFQHFQFAGRADVIAADVDRAALLHLENRTAFPNVQDAAGSFNAKRAYLGPALAERLAIRRWRSETHVVVALWSAEVLHAIRIHRATFASLGPDGVDSFERWWRGDAPHDGCRATLIAFDPSMRRRGARWASGEELASVRPRYRDYADAVVALRHSGRG